MKHRPSAYILAILLAATPANAMTVQTFLAKADALKAKGPLALFSSDIGVLKAEITDAAKAWRPQAASAKPPVCPPAKASTSQDDVMKIMTDVPPAERPRTEVKTAFIRAMNERYRCR